MTVHSFVINHSLTSQSFELIEKNRIPVGNIIVVVRIERPEDIKLFILFADDFNQSACEDVAPAPVTNHNYCGFTEERTQAAFQLWTVASELSRSMQRVTAVPIAMKMHYLGGFRSEDVSELSICRHEDSSSISTGLAEANFEQRVKI